MHSRCKASISLNRRCSFYFLFFRWIFGTTNTRRLRMPLLLLSDVVFNAHFFLARHFENDQSSCSKCMSPVIGWMNGCMVLSVPLLQGGSLRHLAKQYLHFSAFNFDINSVSRNIIYPTSLVYDPISPDIFHYSDLQRSRKTPVTLREVQDEAPCTSKSHVLTTRYQSRPVAYGTYAGIS